MPSASDIKEAGLGHQQRPAEGLIPLQAIEDNARRDARERGGGPQGLVNPHTGLPVVDTSQPGPGAAYARNMMRAFFTTADFGRTGAFSDKPNPQASTRLAAFNRAAGRASFGLSTARGGGKGPVVGPGSPVASGPGASGPRVTLGFKDSDYTIMKGIGAVPGMKVVSMIMRNFFGETPGVVGAGTIAPNIQNKKEFRSVTRLGDLSRDLGRSTAGTGVRSGQALGAQGARGL